MMFDLNLLGMTQEELQHRVVDRAAEMMLKTTVLAYDSDTGGEYEEQYETPLTKRLSAIIKERIDAKFTKLADASILPRVTEMLENLTMQETNKWGEKKGERVTFVEYLVQRAENYLREEVDYDGHAKAECRDSYNWSASTTRVAHLVHKHLHVSVERAMKIALENANSAIVGGLKDAVVAALEGVAKKLKVEVSTR